MDLESRIEPSPVADDQYRLLVDAITDYAIYMLRPDGRVANWNPGAQRFKGYLAHEIIGEHFSRFYVEEDQASGLPARALHLAATEGRFENEGWRVRKDGSRFWAHVVIDPIRDASGDVIGFAKITRDITERRETQLALEQAREALFQSQKLEAIGQLTGGVAHDFNNLLAAVLGSLEMLRKRLPGDAKTASLLDNAMQGAQRGAALTQRMLAFARKQELTLESVDVASLIGGMSGLLQGSLGPLIQLSTRAQPNLPLALSDTNQLETALLNLTLNARDAMPDGGAIVIEATAQTVGENAELPPGQYVRLAVIDDGQGMDPATLLRATEPFYTTKGVGKGTGLGLSMAHGLAAQSGGRLALSSRLGEGTQVELWLPQAAAGTKPASPAQTHPVDETPARPLVVMTVDDDSLVLMNTAAMLEDLGHRPVTASSAAEALLALEGTAVDVVITDHAMPQMTGLQLAHEIAARYLGVPVVLATGYAELPPNANVETPRLAKPYTQAELARLLRKVALPAH